MSMGFSGECGDDGRVRPKIVTGKGRTKQEFKNQVDINKIRDRFRKTGQLDHLNGKKPFYGDVSDLVSYQDAMGVVIKARELFENMPSKIREAFDNDPDKMIKYLDNPKNYDEAVKLGIIVPRPKVDDDAKPLDKRTFKEVMAKSEKSSKKGEDGK